MMTYTLIRAAELLERRGISAEVLHVPTIKPLDEDAILSQLKNAVEWSLPKRRKLLADFAAL